MLIHTHESWYIHVNDLDAMKEPTKLLYVLGGLESLITVFGQFHGLEQENSLVNFATLSTIPKHAMQNFLCEYAPLKALHRALDM